MANEFPDFSRYFGDEKLSDVDLVIYEDTAVIDGQNSSHKRKRGHELVLHCHGVVLGASSAYCRTKLESPSNWVTRPARDNDGGSGGSGSSRTAKHCIEMPVPSGQLEVGQLLVKSMYETRPVYSSISQAQLLQLLLLLADRYEVSRVVAAVCRTLKAIPAQQLDWDTVTAVYQLPAGCAELEACKGAYAAAAAKLQQELGDLELVWADDSGSKQQLLCSLTYVALKQLLQDPDTRVASENTVFYTIERWYKERSGNERPPPQLMNELVQLVRIRHCSQLFVATRMCESRLVQQCFSASELRLACIYGSVGKRAEAHHSTFKEAKCPLLVKYPAWSAAKRPASAMKQLTLDWHVPLADVQQMVEELLQDSSEEPDMHGKIHIWQGVEMHLRLDLSMNGSQNVLLDQFLCLPDMAAGAMCYVTYSQALLGAAGYGAANPAADINEGPDASGFSQESPNWGYKMLKLGAVGSWAEAEAVLRRKQLVHADGCLHLRGVVTQVL